MGEGGLAIVDGNKDGAYPTLLRGINGDNGTVDGCRQQSALRCNGIGGRDGLAVLTVEACEVGFNVESARRMKAKNYAVEDIVEVTSLSAEEIEGL